jgi:hypothetical protein
VTVFVVIMIASCVMLLCAILAVNERGVDGKLAFVWVMESLSLIFGIRTVGVFCAQTPVSGRKVEFVRYCVLISAIRTQEVAI